MKLRPYRSGDYERVKAAIQLLRQARNALAQAGATKAADKVRVALKSAEGAERHAFRVIPLEVRYPPRQRETEHETSR
jgi:hypothetical protein